MSLLTYNYTLNVLPSEKKKFRLIYFLLAFSVVGQLMHC